MQRENVCLYRMGSRPSFKMVLHLGKVKVWATASLQQLLGIVEEVQPEVQQASGDRLSREQEVLLWKMKATWANQKRCYLLQ